MELIKAIEAAALAGIKKERAEISKNCRFWSKQLPRNGAEFSHHNVIRTTLNHLVKRARILDAILKKAYEGKYKTLEEIVNSAKESYPDVE